MIAKIKQMLSKVSKWKYASLGALTLFLLGGHEAFAAVDPDIASTTSAVVTTMKDNILGVITANIENIVIVGVTLFSITFVYKLARSFMSHRS